MMLRSLLLTWLQALRPPPRSDMPPLDIERLALSGAVTIPTPLNLSKRT